MLNTVAITPLNHIPEVLSELKKNCKLHYLPNIGKEKLKEFLIEEKIEAIFTNPNKQNFIIDNDLLQNTSVRLINTASTGTNHINFPDCKSLGVQVISLTKDYTSERNV